MTATQTWNRALELYSRNTQGMVSTGTSWASSSWP